MKKNYFLLALLLTISVAQAETVLKNGITYTYFEGDDYCYAEITDTSLENAIIESVLEVWA